MSDHEDDPRFDGWNVPAHIRGGIVRYIDNGIPPGSFLTAVICNDLIGVCGKADEINRAALFDIVSWFWNEAPSVCWKSQEHMSEWMRLRAQESPSSPGGGSALEAAEGAPPSARETESKE